MTFEGQELVYRVGTLLQMRQYNRRYLPLQSNAPELSPVEFVVLAVHSFHLQLFINGFDGFLFNTDSEFIDFLPIALQAIGAPRYSTLVRKVWEKRTKSNGEFQDELFELIQEEPFDELLISYCERHRDELPDPNLVTAEFMKQAKEDRQRWWAEKGRSRQPSP